MLQGVWGLPKSGWRVAEIQPEASRRPTALGSGILADDRGDLPADAVAIVQDQERVPLERDRGVELPRSRAEPLQIRGLDEQSHVVERPSRGLPKRSLNWPWSSDLGQADRSTSPWLRPTQQCLGRQIANYHRQGRELDQADQ